MSGRIRVSRWTPSRGARPCWNVYIRGAFAGCFWTWRDAMDQALFLIELARERDE